MNTIVKKGLFTLSAVGVLSMAAVPSVSARSFGAAAGAQLAASEASCFDRANGVVTQTCPGSRVFEVQLPVDSFGQKSVAFTGNNGAACNPAATDMFHNSFSDAPAVIADTAAFRSITLNAVTVPIQGKLWLHCTIPQGASVATVVYNH